MGSYPQPHTRQQTDVQVAPDLDPYAIGHTDRFRRLLSVFTFCQTQRQAF